MDETYHNKDTKSLYCGEGCDEAWSDYFCFTGLDRWCHRIGDDKMLKLGDAWKMLIYQLLVTQQEAQHTKEEAIKLWSELQATEKEGSNKNGNSNKMYVCCSVVMLLTNVISVIEQK